MNESIVYEELDPMESFEEFESVRDHRGSRPPRRVVVPGGQSVSTATLAVPGRGNATLTLPQPVATRAHVDILHDALNANTQRINAIQAQQAQLVRLQRTDSSGPSNIFPLLAVMTLFPGLSTFSSSNNLLLLLLLPGILGQQTFHQPGTWTSSSGTQNMGTPNIMMMLVMMIMMKEVTT
ncbi:MAG TPA: hypothetical protein VFP43_20135 [Mesorhizobium sp.]|nr:hypothetical protein [Mesorhizobium sp.]